MKDRRKRKSRRLHRLCWLLAFLAGATILLLSLLHKPGRYNPPEVADEREVPEYLTHVLGTTVNNGIQRGEPFNLPVDQNGMNEVIAWFYKYKWSKQFGEVSYSSPEVFFAPGTISLMGTVAAAGGEFVVTVASKPTLNKYGLLTLRVTKVKIGALNITPIARIIAKTIYQKRLETKPIDKGDIRAKIAASLLNNEPFDPVFRVKDAFENKHRKVRLKKVAIKHKKLMLLLVPLSD